MLKSDKILIEDQDLVINESSFLGETVFKNCNITINVTAKFLVTRNLTFINSHLFFKKKFINYSWADCFFDSCTFKGKLSGNDFGNWPSYFVRNEEERIGDIVNCDFSDCDLDGCRIMDSNARSNKYPKWPHFTLYDPALHLEELKSIEWPDRFRILISSLDYKDNQRVSSETWNFGTLTKFSTSDKVHAILKELPFVEL
jgi:hypothetical protein